MEEALWNLEDRWKLSTQKAIAIFACASFLMIGFCIVGALRRRKSIGIVHQEPCKETSTLIEWAESSVQTSWRSVLVKEVLAGSERWSEPSKWEEGLSCGSRREMPTPLLVRGDVGWQSHNSASAVWQRPILMGEKCELPRFSGLILYDQRGMPLHQFEEGINIDMQEKKAEVVQTTLRDLF